MRGVKQDLTAEERKQLTRARDRFEQTAAAYDAVLVALVERRGAGAVARVLGVSGQAADQAAHRARARLDLGTSKRK